MPNIGQWRTLTSCATLADFRLVLMQQIDAIRNQFVIAGVCPLTDSDVTELAFTQVIELHPPTHIALDSKVLTKLPTYRTDENESYCAEQYVKDIGSILSYEQQLSESQKCKYFLARILNDSQDFKSTHVAVIDYDDLVEAFLTSYGTPERVIVQRLQSLKMYPDKTLAQYNQLFSALLSRISDPIPVSTLSQWYTDGLDRKIQFDVATSVADCTSIQTIMQRAEVIEHAQQRYRVMQKPRDDNKTPNKPQPQQQQQPKANAAAQKADQKPVNVRSRSKFIVRMKTDMLTKLATSQHQANLSLREQGDSTNVRRISQLAPSYRKQCIEQIEGVLRIKGDLEARGEVDELKHFKKQISLALPQDTEAKRDVKNVFASYLKDIMPIPQISQLPKEEGEAMLQRLPGGWSLYVRMLFDSDLCNSIKKACEVQNKRRELMLKRLRDMEEGEMEYQKQDVAARAAMKCNKAKSVAGLPATVQANEAADSVSTASSLGFRDMRSKTPVKSYGMYVECLLNNDVLINALLDNGSTTSGISLPIAQLLKAKLEPYEMYYSNCNGQKHKYEGIIRPFTLSICTPDLVIQMPAMPVMSGKQYSMLVGMDVIGGSSCQLQIIGHNTMYKCITVYDTINNDAHLLEYQCLESLKPRHRDVQVVQNYSDNSSVCEVFDSNDETDED